VGYTGGSNPRPSYESVCAGDGHTEAIKVEYNPEEVSYEKLLNVFYGNCSADSRGKVQYKSAIWVHGQDQKEIATKTAEERGKAQCLQVLEAKEWYDAEDYHQKYYMKNACSMM